MQEKSTPRISVLLVVSIVFFIAVMAFSAYLFLSDRIDMIHLPGSGDNSIEIQLPENPLGQPEFQLPESDENPARKEPPELAQDSPESEEDEPELPALEDSDAYVRAQLAQISGGAVYARWIGMDHLLQRITIVADNVSKGAVPAARIRPLAPNGKFSVIESDEDRYFIDPKGYHRYNTFADTLAKLDLDTVILTYQNLKPLFDKAYAELGYPEGNFEQAVRNAAKHLLKSPILSGEVELVRPAVMYKFADPKLESLSPAQKQLLRMGPRNGRIIHEVLQDFLNKLG